MAKVVYDVSYKEYMAFALVFRRHDMPGITYNKFRLWHDYNQKRLEELTKFCEV